MLQVQPGSPMDTTKIRQVFTFLNDVGAFINKWIVGKAYRDSNNYLKMLEYEADDLNFIKGIIFFSKELCISLLIVCNYITFSK